MAKGKGGEAGWIVTFADLMALLLTFFVLLLSFSNMDAKKYDAVVDGMSEAFTFHWRFFLGVFDDPQGNVAVVPIVDPSMVVVPMDLPEAPEEVAEAVNEPEPAEPPAAVVQASAEELYGALADALEAQIASGGVHVEGGADSVVIRFDERISFGTGDAGLVASFKESLDRIGPVLESAAGDIVVSGHTDDRPIANAQFRSNWDLSAARAVSVVHYLLETTALDPARIIAQGRADTLPLLPNDSDAHRAENRRVEISISGR